jgi:hypothetical protein
LTDGHAKPKLAGNIHAAQKAGVRQRFRAFFPLDIPATELTPAVFRIIIKGFSKPPNRFPLPTLEIHHG